MFEHGRIDIYTASRPIQLKIVYGHLPLSLVVIEGLRVQKRIEI